MFWVGVGFLAKWHEREFAGPGVLKGRYRGIFSIANTSRARPLPFDPAARPFRE